jgi:hypothetical protein
LVEEEVSCVSSSCVFKVVPFLPGRCACLAPITRELPSLEGEYLDCQNAAETQVR